MKKTALLISIALLLFILLGAASAAEIDNVTSTENVNLTSESNELSLDDLSASNSDFALKSSDDSIDEDTLLMNSENDSVLAGNDSTPTNITPVKTKITLSNAHYSKSNTKFKMLLTDAKGNPISGKKITFTINGKSYKATTGNNGVAYATTPSFKAGTYKVTAKFNGDSEFVKSSISKKIKVLTSITKRTNAKKTYGYTLKYTAYFWQDNGRLKNTNVRFTVDGTKKTVKTDSNGLGSLSLKLKGGKHTIKLYNPYSKETTTNTITINKAKSVVTGTNTYALPQTKHTYAVILSNAQKQPTPLKNVKCQFTFKNKNYAKTTDANGKAKITFPALSKGTYTVTFKYNGNGNYKPVTGTFKLYVKDSTTTLKASNLKMQYNDGSLFSVTATNSAGKALTNKNIKFTFNDKTTTVKTDSSGTAKLAIGNLKPGTYTVTAKYSTPGLKDYNIKTNTVTISKQTVTISASDLVMEHDNLKNYVVTIKNKTGSPLSGLKVEFGLNSKNHEVKTAADGTATLAINEPIGYYPITIELGSNTYYTSSKVTKHILVNGTKFSASDMTVVVKTAAKFTVKLLDGQDKPVVGKTVKFTLNNKDTSVQTDKNGAASIDVSGLAKGTYTVTYTDGKASGSSKINVVESVTLKEVIAASQTVKKYIENNEKLPETVKVGTTTLTTAQYLYLASQAIINLKAGTKGNIGIKAVTNPTKPGAAANLGNLYDYLTVAKNLVNTINSKGAMPNSVSSNIGTIGYDGLVYAFARVVAYYGDNSFMPNYVSIKAIETSTSSPLNTKNTIKDLKPYLVATTNCQVGNSKIKSIVNSLIDGLTTDKAKATALYNYVRDKVSYSFYYNTKYGAVGTLNAKTGNCVDQAHLLIAMYRTAGIPARYVHGTCVFSDGTYGHVWTQVLIGDTWIVGDPTSTRNSFGNVVSWNNYNYQLKGYYASISF